MMAADETEFWAAHYGAGTDENLWALAQLLKPWRCCGASQLCGARCQDDELSAGLANAERLVREARDQGDRDEQDAMRAAAESQRADEDYDEFRAEFMREEGRDG